MSPPYPSVVQDDDGYIQYPDGAFREQNKAQIEYQRWGEQMRQMDRPIQEMTIPLAAAVTGGAAIKSGLALETAMDYLPFYAINSIYDDSKGDYDTLTNRISSWFPPEGLSDDELEYWNNGLKTDKQYISHQHAINMLGGTAAFFAGKHNPGLWYGGTIMNELGSIINLPKSRQKVADDESTYISQEKPTKK